MVNITKLKNFKFVSFWLVNFLFLFGGCLVVQLLLLLTHNVLLNVEVGEQKQKEENVGGGPVGPFDREVAFDE